MTATQPAQRLAPPGPSPTQVPFSVLGVRLILQAKYQLGAPMGAYETLWLNRRSLKLFRNKVHEQSAQLVGLPERVLIARLERLWAQFQPERGRASRGGEQELLEQALDQVVLEREVYGTQEERQRLRQAPDVRAEAHQRAAQVAFARIGLDPEPAPPPDPAPGPEPAGVPSSGPGARP